MNKFNQWLNPNYLSNKEISKIRNNFLKSKPYLNFALNDFFNKNKLLNLRKEILKEKFQKQDKDLFSFSNTKELKFSNNMLVREFYDFLSSSEFLGLMSKLTNEKSLRHIDMHAHLFRQGDYLLFHDDVVEGRVIAYIIYLSDLNPNDGGALRLYDANRPLNPVKRINPKFNTFACFKVSSKSMHDVEEVRSEKQRLTIGGWFYGN